MAEAVERQIPQWSEFVDLLKPAGELINETFFPASGQLRAELYRQLTMNLSLGYFLYFQTDLDHPDWTPFLNSVFMLQPNPDDTYFNAHVSAAGVYRIVGERGTVKLLTFSLGQSVMGTSDSPGKSLAYVDIDDLAIGPDGRFEVMLSAERPPGHSGNWVHLPAGTDYILFRQRSYDWGAERDARLAIERLDTSGGMTRPTAAQIERDLRALMGGFAARLSRRWISYQNTLFQRGLVNTLEMTDFGGAVPVQWYWQGVYQFAADECLILETELPERRKYWNVQLNDELFNAVEFVHRQSSLNGHQARIDPDGKFRAVISLQDPGVHNWLDSGGTLQGVLIGRWYDCDTRPLPTLTRVPLRRMWDHLPAGAIGITPAERAAAMSVRRIGAQLRRRW
ncbi:MAG TPA: DUF1214 domain-containing protein [Steroidobacteraceae bacterium]|nr:DUF1214 domain-containing protein [Steroidobacteraceae bacterium]